MEFEKILSLNFLADRQFVWSIIFDNPRRQLFI